MLGGQQRKRETQLDDVIRLLQAWTRLFKLGCLGIDKIEFKTFSISIDCDLDLDSQVSISSRFISIQLIDIWVVQNISLILGLIWLVSFNLYDVTRILQASARSFKLGHLNIDENWVLFYLDSPINHFDLYTYTSLQALNRIEWDRLYESWLDWFEEFRPCLFGLLFNVILILYDKMQQTNWLQSCRYKYVNND